MIVNIPPNGPNFLIGRDGREYRVQQLADGRIVADLLATDFMSLLMGPQGKIWSDANPEAHQQLAQFRIPVF